MNDTNATNANEFLKSVQQMTIHFQSPILTFALHVMCMTFFTCKASFLAFNSVVACYSDAARRRRIGTLETELPASSDLDSHFLLDLPQQPIPIFSTLSLTRPRWNPTSKKTTTQSKPG